MVRSKKYKKGDLVNHNRFIAALTKRFPEVGQRIDEDDRGVLTLEMHTFCEATREAISKCDSCRVGAYLRFVDWAYAMGDNEVKGAIRVSYLEHIDFESPKGMVAGRHLTPLLRHAIKENLANLEATYQAWLKLQKHG